MSNCLFPMDYNWSTSSQYGDDLSTIQRKTKSKKVWSKGGTMKAERSFYAEHVGALPVIMGLTLEHLATVGAPLNLRSTLLSSTPSHGTPLLQARITPSEVPDVPLMFLKETLLIFIFDGF